MSVKIAILKSSCSGFAEPTELMISADAAASASTAPIAALRTFTCPPYE